MADDHIFWSERYQRRLDLWETEYGRNTDWLLEYEGRVLARLTDSRCEEMFWYSYEMAISTEDEEWRQRLLDAEWWEQGPAEVTFYNPTFDASCNSAFAAGLGEDGRPILRALSVKGPSPMPWDQLVLWWRRRK